MTDLVITLRNELRGLVQKHSDNLGNFASKIGKEIESTKNEHTRKELLKLLNVASSMNHRSITASKGLVRPKLRVVK